MNGNLKKTCKALLIGLFSLSTFWLAICAMSFVQYWIVYANYEGYHKEVLVLEKVRQVFNAEGDHTCFTLEGQINKKDERVTIHQKKFEAYRARKFQGEKVEVLYNAQLPRIILQGNSLRVMFEDDYNKNKEAVYVNAVSTTLVGIVPLGLVALLYLGIYLFRR